MYAGARWGWGLGIEAWLEMADHLLWYCVQMHIVHAHV